MKIKKLSRFQDELLKEKEIGLEHDGALAKDAELKRIVRATLEPEPAMEFSPPTPPHLVE